MEEISEVVKEFKSRINDIYGSRLKDVIIYGSWARGDATEDSDIDLLVVLKGDVMPGREIDRMIDAITELNLEYRVLISVVPVSEDDFLTVNSPLMMNVRAEGVPA